MFKVFFGHNNYIILCRQNISSIYLDAYTNILSSKIRIENLLIKSYFILHFL